MGVVAKKKTKKRGGERVVQVRIQYRCRRVNSISKRYSMKI